VTARVAAGLLLATAIALAARRTGSLSSSGAVAAVVCGTLAVAAGWGWGVLLIAFFATSSALSRVGERRRAERTAGIVAKSGARDARQVLANGGIFAAAATAAIVVPWPGWLAAGAGSLAAATADTWGTEVGTLARRPPRLITTGRPVPPGTSGGVSAPGLAATVAGALFTGALLPALGAPARFGVAAAVGGVAGALADSLLGAVAQERRRCPRCAASTEQRIHGCGTPTERTGGWGWLDNDAVNLLCGGTGAAVALLIAA
jgi:uncharacterized protein (TIGR00297 family)